MLFRLPVYEITDGVAEEESSAPFTINGISSCCTFLNTCAEFIFLIQSKINSFLIQSKINSLRNQNVHERDRPNNSISKVNYYRLVIAGYFALDPKHFRF